MLRHYYINKEWMVSRRARQVYRTSAALSIGLFVLVVYLGMGIPAGDDPSLVRFLLFVGILGAAMTMVAMEYFWFGFDKSPGLKKAFWFCALLFPPLGPALYCLFVYSRSPVVEREE